MASWWDDNGLASTGQGFDESGGQFGLSSPGQGFDESGGQFNLSSPTGGFNEGMQLSAPTQTGVNPALMGGNTGFNGGQFGGNQLSAPTTTQPGGFIPTQQNFLDWATQKYGADPTRGSGFVNAAAGGGLQNMVAQYNQANGTNVKFTGGPSGDRLNFGQGDVDALTSGGQIWNPNDGNTSNQLSAPTGGGGGGGGGNFLSGTNGGGGGGGGNVTLPTAPGIKDLTAPSPFTYQQSNLGNFQGPAPYQGAGDVPHASQLSYNSMQTPDPFSAQQQGTPDRLTYQNQAAAPTLNYTNLGTPEGYQAEKYTGLSQSDLENDPSYQFRFKQGQAATENALAHSGALRTGNAVQALSDYGQQSASQEYAAADARKRQTVAGNNASSLGAYQTNAQTALGYNQNANQNALNFGNANFQNQFNVGAANNAGNMAATQGNVTNQYNATNANNQSNQTAFQNNFNNAFNVNQANNAGTNQAAQLNNQNAFQQQQAQYQQGSNTQNQAFTQAAQGYGLNQAAQNQQYQQALGAYGQNAQTQLAYGSQNQNNQLANYQAQVNAALGQGSLNLGFQNSNNSYALGQGQLGLGQQQFGLQQQGQNFNQNLATYNTNYQNQVLTPWNQQYQLAQLGNPGAPNGQQYANAQSDLYTGQGNANAAGQVGAANAWGAGVNNLSNIGMGAYGNWQQQQGLSGTTQVPYPGYGVYQ